ncbi:MAG TPA: cell division protein FtsA, partial [Candidatus Latescibacteria bacterium]|nr:cell division protein FtsA [Candidatus Latescibacterota bacterium]
MPLGRIVAGLDVGTTKVTTIIAEVDESEAVSVIGVGQTESRGVERGMIVNLDETVDSIQKSVERAQHMAGCRISSVYVGIGGEHIRGINSHAAVTVGKITNEISEEDVKRVIDHAQNVSMPADMTVIHVIP